MATADGAEKCAGLGAKPLFAHRLRQHGLVLDRNDRFAAGDKEDGLDEEEQQGAAVRISDLGQKDGGVFFVGRSEFRDSDARYNTTSH